MRTNVVIDDRLMEEALRQSGLRTKKAAIERGLKLPVQLGRQGQVRKYRGQLRWVGDLDRMRKDT